MRPLIALLMTLPLVAAGCVGAPDDVNTAATTPDAALAASATSSPFAFDGNIAPAVTVCPLVTCAQPAPTGDRVAPLDHAGNITAVLLTMTWDATAPSTSALRLGISWGEQGDMDYEMVEGASPLVLDLKGLDIAKGVDAYVWVWMPTPVPMGIATVSTPQDFHVEGNVTTEAVA